MRRRNGTLVQAGLLLLGALGLAVGPAAVAGVSVAQACKEVSCFSGVVAACGSCLPAQADAVSGGQHRMKVGGACLEGGRAGRPDCRLSAPLQLPIALGIPLYDVWIRHDTGVAAFAAAAARTARYFMRE